jgi:hypothetical protein
MRSTDWQIAAPAREVGPPLVLILSLEDIPCSFSQLIIAHQSSFLLMQLKGVLVARPSRDGSFSFCKEA